TASTTLIFGDVPATGTDDVFVINDTMVFGDTVAEAMHVEFGAGAASRAIFRLSTVDSTLSFNGSNLSRILFATDETTAQGKIETVGTPQNALTNPVTAQFVQVRDNDASGVVDIAATPRPIQAFSSVDLEPGPPSSSPNWFFIGGGSLSLKAAPQLGD